MHIRIQYICQAFLQYGLTCVFTDHLLVSIYSHILNICMVSRHYGFSYVSLECLHVNKHNHILYICLVFSSTSSHMSPLVDVVDFMGTWKQHVKHVNVNCLYLITV